jgi:predicted N-formylglutamate amidohydrolase
MGVKLSMSLLGANDPPPVRVTNPGGRSSFLLIGDHAGRTMPAMLGSLGLGEADLDRHIAWDIGVAGLGRRLAVTLDACFIEQIYSRLVIDCNRAADSDEACVSVSDGTPVPGNMGLGVAERAERLRAIHMPYQAAVAAELARRDAGGRLTILVSLHSFTPVMGGVARPWDVGVLYDRGSIAFALALLDRFRAMGDRVVGDNEPYRMDDTDHSVPRHAYEAGRPYAEMEIRQDHLADVAGQAAWSNWLAGALRAVARESGLS